MRVALNSTEKQSQTSGKRSWCYPDDIELQVTGYGSCMPVLEVGEAVHDPGLEER